MFFQSAFFLNLFFVRVDFWGASSFLGSVLFVVELAWFLWGLFLGVCVFWGDLFLGPIFQVYFSGLHMLQPGPARSS